MRAAALDRHLGQSGALPLAASGAGGAELTESLPLLEVGGSVEEHLVGVGQGDGHNPAARGGGPEDVRVTEVQEVEIENGVRGVLGPGAAAVVAVGKVLSLEGL